jgi:hypothetical protein
MAREFRTADYEKTLELQITLRDVLPPDHLARFIAYFSDSLLADKRVLLTYGVKKTCLTRY